MIYQENFHTNLMYWCLQNRWTDWLIDRLSIRCHTIYCKPYVTTTKFTSEHIRFYFVVFLFFHFLVGSVRRLSRLMWVFARTLKQIVSYIYLLMFTLVYHFQKFVVFFGRGPGERPFECTSCSKRFARMGQLARHVRIHTGEKPYQCATCGKAFGRSEHLRIHMKFHSGEKAHQCTVCRQRSVCFLESQFNSSFT